MDRAGRIALRYGDLASGRLDDDLNLYAYVGNDAINRGDPTGTFDVSFFNTEATGDRLIEAALGDAHVPGAYFVGSHGNQRGPMSSSAITNGEYSHDYRDWMFVRNEQILSNYPKGSGIPIILYSCFAGDSASTAASLSRDAGAVVYGAQDFAWTRQLRPGVVEAFSAAKDAKGNPGARSSFVAIGSGSRPFGNAITSIVFDKNTGKATVNYKEVETGSRIPVNKEATVCMDEKCKK